MGKISRVVEIMESPESDDRVPKGEINVLVVDDEDLVADMHNDWVSSEGYSTEVAYGGKEALRKLNPDTDVVLLDRRMPKINGDQVLEVMKSDYVGVIDPEEISSEENVIDEIDWNMDISPDTARNVGSDILKTFQNEGIDCLVCMVTAVYPSFKIMEMEFDHYLTKNVEKEEMLKAVKGLSVLGKVNEDAREYNSLLRKKQILEDSKSSQELRESDEYKDIQERLEEIESKDSEVKELRKIEW